MYVTTYFNDKVAHSKRALCRSAILWSMDSSDKDKCSLTVLTDSSPTYRGGTFFFVYTVWKKAHVGSCTLKNIWILWNRWYLYGFRTIIPVHKPVGMEYRTITSNVYTQIIILYTEFACVRHILSLSSVISVLTVVALVSGVARIISVINLLWFPFDPSANG